MWQLHRVEDYSDGSQSTLIQAGCALICRLHHSLADGLAVVHLLLPGVQVNPMDIVSSLIVLMIIPLAIGLFVKACYSGR